MSYTGETRRCADCGRPYIYQINNYQQPFCRRCGKVRSEGLHYQGDEPAAELPERYGSHARARQARAWAARARMLREDIQALTAEIDA
jgi:hypothetical protein